MKRTDEPPAASMREMPEVDFSLAIANPFAKYFARHGLKFARRARAESGPAETPSKASLREMPERDFSSGRRDPRRFAAPLARTGLVFRVGPGRPRNGAPVVGRSSVRSVRLPDKVWDIIGRSAKRQKVSVHALLRKAIVKLAGG